jgi:hypothetical protein
LTGQEQKILFVHKKIVIPVTTEAETTVTLVSENKVHQAIGVAIHVATDVHTRKETSRDTKITALENPINLITITTDLQIDPRQDYGDQRKNYNNAPRAWPTVQNNSAYIEGTGPGNNQWLGQRDIVWYNCNKRGHIARVGQTMDARINNLFLLD